MSAKQSPDKTKEFLPNSSTAAVFATTQYTSCDRSFCVKAFTQWSKKAYTQAKISNAAKLNSFTNMEIKLIGN